MAMATRTHAAYSRLYINRLGLWLFILSETFLFAALLSGRFTRGTYWGVEGVVKYWHFVDVAWVLIYPTLYLVS